MYYFENFFGIKLSASEAEPPPPRLILDPHLIFTFTFGHREQTWDGTTLIVMYDRRLDSSGRAATVKLCLWFLGKLFKFSHVCGLLPALFLCIFFLYLWHDLNSV